MKRQVFYSFHYQPDAQRASQVRQIGAIEGNRPASDNDWEQVTKGGNKAIEKWIASQLQGRSCTVVLVGQSTANRKWINYEIRQSWNAGMGVVGIRIHGLKNLAGQTAAMGKNPFDYIDFSSSTKRLSSAAKCYTPTGSNSKERYAWIAKNLAAAVEQAIQIRSQYKS
jgi:Thoeris protein ThsB, TIR-like domain